MQGVSISVSWAISQYRQVVAAIGTRVRSTNIAVKVPRESPEVISYLRAMGIGRNIDVYV